MIPLASLRTGGRRAALVCVSVAALLAPASAAQAQRLLTLVPGVVKAASADDLGPSIGPVPTAVQVDLALLRSAPVRLEVPTPEGGVLSAERSVFEDRGGGDLMWSGGQPGAGYDTVVLTVEGGRLVGRFAAAGGGAYQIHAERDGLGGMAPLGGPALDGPVPLCGVESGAEEGHDAFAHIRAGALAANPPRRVSDPQSHDRLDILVGYTATAAENWADRGGAHAAIRHAVDYMKMVFRNNRIEVEPHLVHVAQASAALDRAGRDLGWHLIQYRPLLGWFDKEDDLLHLRHEHGADFVHLFTGEHPLLLGACGTASQLGEGQTAQDYSKHARSWTTNHPLGCPDYAVTFVHEIGHGLGANHDPANAGDRLSLIWPYAFGHADLDVMPGLGTAMSYHGQVEPFFSTLRLRPHDAILGIAGERDNERLLQETVHIAVRYSDYLASLDPAPPSDVRVRFEGGAAHLTWRDNAPEADGYEVESWYTTTSGRSRRRFQMLKGRTGAVLPLEWTEPGTRYWFYVRATKGDERSLPGNVPVLIVPGEPIAAPSDVSTFVISNGIQVRWTDNSDDESGFDVQLLQGSETIHRKRVVADREFSSFLDSRVNVQGGAEYGVRVFAFNRSGYSESSEVATFRWELPGGPGPVTGVSARAIGPTTVRLAWTVEPGVGYQVAVLLPDGSWADIRRWGGLRDGVTAWEDFEGLARGGRYGFEIRPVNGVAVWTYLTLGERGTGPRAPSDLASVLEGNRVRLSWKDNSSDELGFEVQVDRGHFFSGELRWLRVLTVPADTESAVVAPPYSDGRRHFRVFAYNDRGYSRAAAPGGSCRADAETLCLQDSRFQVKMTWWKADGESGVGRVVEEGTGDSGLFQFFGPENWEVLIKVLNGCRTNGRVWVLGASTTDLGYRIVVTDTITDESRTYTNEPGRPAPAIVDTKAFSQPCRGGAAP